MRSSSEQPAWLLVASVFWVSELPLPLALCDSCVVYFIHLAPHPGAHSGHGWSPGGRALWILRVWADSGNYDVRIVGQLNPTKLCLAVIPCPIRSSPSTNIRLAQAFPHPKTNPTSVAFYDIWVGNGAGLFFQQLLAQAHMGRTFNLLDEYASCSHRHRTYYYAELAVSACSDARTIMVFH